MGFSFIPKEEKFFELFEAQAAHNVEAAKVFHELTQTWASDSTAFERLRDIEHEADITLTVGALLNCRDEVLRLAEAAQRHSSVLFVVEGDAATHGLGDRGGYGLVAHGELEDLGHRARKIGHGQFALPSLANPAPIGKFLDKA